MKTKFLTLIFALATMLTFAQTSEHLTFKSVPINGTLNEYVLKMKQNGFTHIQTVDGNAILNGDFAGYKDCVINVSTLKQKDLVHKIAVIFSDKKTWSTLSSNYFDLKQMLTEKYGEPSQVIEKFDGYSTDDQMKMLQVSKNNCKYYSTWLTEKGNIELSIENDRASFLTGFIKLVYIDKSNGNIIRQNAKDDL